MPLYEYECLNCGKRFEAFVTGKQKPTCPSCGSEDLEKQISVFGVGSSSSGKASSAGGGCSPSGGG